VQSDLYAASENYEAARKSAETAIGVAADASGIESEGQRTAEDSYMMATIRVGKRIDCLQTEQPDALKAYNSAVGIAANLTSVAEANRRG